MYFLFKIENAQVELEVSEQSFLKIAESDFNKIILLLSKHESLCVDYRISPRTVAEAKWMMYAYCSLVKLNQTVPKWLIDYFYIPFKSILNGGAPAHAFSLTNPPHRPKESHVADRNRKIFLEISDLMRCGARLFDASLEMSDKYHLHESHIQKIYSALKKAELLQEAFIGSFDEIAF